MHTVVRKKSVGNPLGRRAFAAGHLIPVIYGNMILPGIVEDNITHLGNGGVGLIAFHLLSTAAATASLALFALAAYSGVSGALTFHRGDEQDCCHGILLAYILYQTVDGSFERRGVHSAEGFVGA